MKNFIFNLSVLLIMDITRKLFLIFIIVFITQPFYSQSELMGTTSNGGLYGAGSIYKTDINGDNYSVAYSFPQLQGAKPKKTSLIQATDGNLYGMTFGGGLYNRGVIFQYDFVNDNYDAKYNFLNDGSNPKGSLYQASDGKLYGLTFGGGSNFMGTLFQYDISTNTYTKKIDLSSTIGSKPEGSLIQYTDGKLYGMTSSGGANGLGVIFQYDLITNTYLKKIDFIGMSNGAKPLGDLMQASDGKLYGLTSYGGAYNKGVLFQYDPNTNTVVKKHDFDSINGSVPCGNLVEYTNGKFYGLTSKGGIQDSGTLFCFDINSNVFNKNIDFNQNNYGTYPLGSLNIANDGYMYGMTSSGGINNLGVLFQYEPVNNNFYKKYDFSLTSGGATEGSFIQATNGKLYALASNNGIYENGTLFQYDILNDSLIKKIDLTEALYGKNPASLIQLTDGSVYGTTSLGGKYNQGTIFQFLPNTNTFSKKFDFDGVNTFFDNYCGLIQANNGMLYAMSYVGGANGSGLIYKFDPITLSYSIIHSFDCFVDGCQPFGALFQASNGKLYGVTYTGGANFKGILFQFDISSNTFLKILDFDGNINGGNPSVKLMEATNGKIYGVTGNGGINNNGVLFEYDFNANVYTKKTDFSSINYGMFPVGGLVQVSDSIMYGSTVFGGVNSIGVIYKYNMNSNVMTKVFDFNEFVSGKKPSEDFLKTSNDFIFGVTAEGGANGRGVLFKYDYLNNIYTKKKDFDFYSGSPSSNLIEIRSLLLSTKSNDQKHVLVYPNPSNGKFEINFNYKSNITITDVFGNIILKKEFDMGKQVIDIQNYPNGLYILNAEVNEKKIVCKLIKQ